LTTHQVAELLQISKRSVLDKAKQKVLPSVRIPGGRQLRFPESKILALLDDR
jgi:excisionase family DNA binding protein